MIACPSCGTDLPDGSRFCLQCGSALAPPSAHSEERKVVTTLFCDLVGSTALGEEADPEDVDALLRRYNALARQVVESYGGTVEKFIGDAVVAVFGVPAAHEDDPERAVRAGLRFVSAVEELPPVAGHAIQVRVGINTGGALVRLDVTPGSGEGFLTGDAVNVGARLQSAAPPMGVVVGATTHELTKKAIVYEALEPVAAKGKREPLAVWLAKSSLARTGAQAFERATPFVGRTVELAFLAALLDKAADTASPQVALVVGEPGIGKSRLVAALFDRVDAGNRLVTWRQGRCLPYGEGVTFWALAEIVKAHAGILENDGREAVEAKLEEVLPEGEDREWFRQRLRALLGLEASGAEREENFTAWLRFLEEIASRNPTVLVIEDLHWADEALLAFVAHVATHAAEVPLFLVATARPELFEEHPSFAATSRVNRVALEPLSAAETETLVDSLLRETTSGVRETIVRHAEGNPFYAEESARLMMDRVRARLAPGMSGQVTRDRGELAPSVQAVIAARLDGLQAALKALLADASVVGETFWDGALATVGGRSPEEVDAGLHELIEKHLVHRARTSSMAGEREFAFSHSLAREVAYGELPRAVRARKHSAVAGWIEQKAGDQAEDLAEILAHHFATALDLANAAGEVELADSVLESAVRYLTLAGDRAWSLDVAAAENHYARALELAGPESPDRPRLLAKWAKAATQRGRGSEAIEAYQEAIAGLKAAGDVRAAAIAQMGLAYALPLYDTADHLGYLRLSDEAVEMLEADGPSPELLTVLTDWLAIHWGEGDFRRQLEVADRATELAQQLGLPVDPRLLCMRGSSRCDLGDTGGLDDIKQALQVARTSGAGEHAGEIFWEVGSSIYIYKGFQATMAICTEGLDLSRRRGAVDWEVHNRMMIVWASEVVGDWDRALDDAVALDPLLEAPQFEWPLIAVRLSRTLVLVERGRVAEAVDLVEWLEKRPLEESEHTNAARCIVTAAARMALGDSVRAVSLLARSETALRGEGGFWWAELLPQAVRIAIVGEDCALAERLAGSIEPLQPLSRHAIVAARALLSEAHGEHEMAAAGFADAAARWHEFGVPYEEAQALLGQGRCLVALGRAPEAAAPLSAAREIFARLGAKPALGGTEDLLRRVSSD